jgi:hypothetical protein
MPPLSKMAEPNGLETKTRFAGWGGWGLELDDPHPAMQGMMRKKEENKTLREHIPDHAPDGIAYRRLFAIKNAAACVPCKKNSGT